jgi:hypothetical protein
MYGFIVSSPLQSMAWSALGPVERRTGDAPAGTRSVVHAEVRGGRQAQRLSGAEQRRPWVGRVRSTRFVI